jgi:hypothetical protein
MHILGAPWSPFASGRLSFETIANGSDAMMVQQTLSLACGTVAQSRMAPFMCFALELHTGVTVNTRLSSSRPSTSVLNAILTGDRWHTGHSSTASSLQWMSLGV